MRQVLEPILFDDDGPLRTEAAGASMGVPMQRSSGAQCKASTLLKPNLVLLSGLSGNSPPLPSASYCGFAILFQIIGARLE